MRERRTTLKFSITRKNLRSHFWVREREEHWDRRVFKRLSKERAQDEDWRLLVCAYQTNAHAHLCSVPDPALLLSEQALEFRRALS